MTDTRKSRVAWGCDIRPNSTHNNGPNWGKSREPIYFPHLNRTQSRWWTVDTPDGMWIHCATLREAVAFAKNWAEKNNAA